MTNSARKLRVGSDYVFVEENRIFIQSSRVMDWPVREFCRIPIWFSGKKHFLRATYDGEARGSIVYELLPWPDDLHDESGRSVVYDEEFVAERDATARQTRRRSAAYWCLLPFYPALGLFWSEFKDRFLIPLGFESGAITKASVVMMFNLFVLEGIFCGWLMGGLLAYLISPSLRWLDWFLLLIIGFDTAMRFGQSLQTDIDRHWGTCEWMFPRKR